MWTKPRYIEIKMDAEAKSYMDDLDSTTRKGPRFRNGRQG